MTQASRDDDTRAIEQFYEDVRAIHGRPLWRTAGTGKKAATLPYLWRYADFRPLLFQAAEIVPIEFAERRVLVMANPGIRSDWQASNSLLANLQIILPGEIARSHRHSASALRLVIEGSGAFTAVNGERSTMAPGDFVTTPNWTWHDHGHDGDGPMVWLDGLDVPFVQQSESSFFELYPEKTYPVDAPDDLSVRLYGGGALRPSWIRHDRPWSPLLSYRFADVYARLKQIAEETDGSPFDGVSLEYVNPQTGGPALATMACFAALLQPGQRTRAHRHVGGTIYHVIKGGGTSVIEGVRFRWAEKDTFVVPSWHWHEHLADSEAVLFSYSDSPVLQPLGLYREEALATNGGHQEIVGDFMPLPVPGRPDAEAAFD